MKNMITERIMGFIEILNWKFPSKNKEIGKVNWENH